MDVLNFLFPQNCIICGKSKSNYLCFECKRRIERHKRFGLIDNQKLVMDKLNIKNKIYQQYYFVRGKKIYYEKMIYCFSYEGIIRKFMLEYKFSSKPYLYEFFGNQILESISKIENYDFLISVPMDKNKKANRGYNQTELISKYICKKMSLKYEDILIKAKLNETQSSLSLKQRKQNVEGVYKIKENVNLKNKSVILLDDIFTTGSTVNEISKILKMNKVKNILVLVIAKK